MAPKFQNVASDSTELLIEVYCETEGATLECGPPSLLTLRKRAILTTRRRYCYMPAQEASVESQEEKWLKHDLAALGRLAVF